MKVGHTSAFPFGIYWRTLKNLKNQNIEKMKKKKKKKNCWRYHHFTHVYEQPQSYKAWLLSNGVRQTEFFVIFGIFFPFTPLSISAS